MMNPAQNPSVDPVLPNPAQNPGMAPPHPGVTPPPQLPQTPAPDVVLPSAAPTPVQADVSADFGISPTAAPGDVGSNTVSTDLYSTMTSQVNTAPQAPPVNAGPTFQGGVLMDDRPATPAAPPVTPGVSAGASSVGSDDPLKPNCKKRSPVIPIVVGVVLTILIGGGVFYLYHHQQNQISAYRANVDTLSEQVISANRRVAQAEIDAQAQAETPLFADTNGVFSFFQRFTGVVVIDEGNRAVGTFGTDGDGFEFVASSGSLGGLTLNEFMLEQLANPPVDAVAYDERPEVLGMYQGYSYVIQSGNEETIVYLFVRDDNSVNYFQFEYTITGGDEASIVRSEEMVWRILSSVKLYQ
ncbi:MAG: hypothetical protein LBG64_01215 [Pseudomonadales bacterium]|jgi:hypothetical protein|nr:hypothetical protein [Pseudomonadales bacterium]